MPSARFGTAVLAVCLFCLAVPALAQTEFTANLQPRQEVPAISSFAGGTFRATMNADRTEIEYELNYSNVDAPVTQAHIHFAQQGVNGGIVVFLCTNLGNGPAETQVCPAAGGTIAGTITAEDVGASANAQGMPTGGMFEFTRAMLQGVTYANVHSQLFPGGELRGQIKRAAAAADAPETE